MGTDSHRFWWIKDSKTFIQLSLLHKPFTGSPLEAATAYQSLANIVNETAYPRTGYPHI
jgi:hypothetical protein